jgi:hypothetical protein
LALCGLSAVAIAAEKPGADSALRQDRLIAGSEQDFMIVRHLVLKGSNEAIGRALADVARERHATAPVASKDPVRTRAQRHYIEKNFPILYDRMRGVAGAFGKRVEDNAWNFSELDYAHLSFGCSVIHFPPAVTATGSSIVSRDYDFTIGNPGGVRPRPGTLAATARPYLVEMHPDRGYPSLAMVAYDLLSGTLDGINSEGLTVALLADDELIEKFGMEPAGAEGVGIGSLQMLRLLLDTCATVEEAKEALLTTKQYYEFVPVHYLIADRNGKSFVWEYSQAHNREYIVENPGKPLVTTNFSLHRYLDNAKPPSTKAVEKVCPRYCILTERLGDRPEKLTVDYIKQTHKLVDATRDSPDPKRLPNRTLWHALYFPEQRKMQVSFYLKDEPAASQPGKAKVVRSEYLEFRLGEAGAGRGN